MNKVKMIFSQTLMVSTAILFGLGIQQLILYLSGIGDGKITWQWYIPLSIVLTGFLSSLPSLLLTCEFGGSKVKTVIVILLHFLMVFGIVSGSGYLFGWYVNSGDFLLIAVMYVIIYSFVWAATVWLMRSDDNKINRALDEIRDPE